MDHEARGQWKRTLYAVIHSKKEYVYCTLNGKLKIILGITGEYWNNSENNRWVKKELLERIIGNLKSIIDWSL